MDIRRTVVLSVMCFAWLSGCASTAGTESATTGWRTEVIEKPSGPFASWIKVQYVSADQQREYIHDQAKVQLWTPQRIEQALSHVNEGGSIAININAPSIDLAKPNFIETVVTTEEGTEIVRQTGPDISPNLPLAGDRMWSSGYAFSLPSKPTGPLKIYVIDTALNKRVAFRLIPPSAAP